MCGKVMEDELGQCLINVGKALNFIRHLHLQGETGNIARHKVDLKGIDKN